MFHTIAVCAMASSSMVNYYVLMTAHRTNAIMYVIVPLKNGWSFEIQYCGTTTKDLDCVVSRIISVERHICLNLSCDGANNNQGCFRSDSFGQKY